MKQTRQPWVSAGALALACATLTSCAGGATEGSKADPSASSSASIPKYLAKLPFESKEAVRQAARYDNVVLPIAPCALHDPKAAEKVTNLTATQLEPGTDITECTLRVKGPDLDKAWNLYISVGENFNAISRQESASMTIGGVRFYKTRSGDGSCDYSYEMAKELAINLGVQASGATDSKKFKSKACGIGKKYLEKVAKYWKDPPERTQGVTAPKLMLGMQSPCETIDRARKIVPPLQGKVKTTVSRLGPSSCSIEDETSSDPAGRTRASVSFEVGDSPKLLGKEGTYKAIEVGGKPAIVQPPNSPDYPCEVVVQYGKGGIDMNLKRPGENVVTQNILVEAQKCGIAKKYAKVALNGALS